MERLMRLFRESPDGLLEAALDAETIPELEQALSQGLVVERPDWASAVFVLTDAGREAFGLPPKKPSILKALFGL